MSLLQVNALGFVVLNLFQNLTLIPHTCFALLAFQKEDAPPDIQVLHKLVQSKLKKNWCSRNKISGLNEGKYGILIILIPVFLNPDNQILIQYK